MARYSYAKEKYCHRICIDKANITISGQDEVTEKYDHYNFEKSW